MRLEGGRGGAWGASHSWGPRPGGDSRSWGLRPGDSRSWGLNPPRARVAAERQGRGSGWCGDRMRGRRGLVGRAAGGQGECDAQPVRVVEAGLRGAVVRGSDSVDDGEAEPGSGRAVPARAAAVEAVEDAGELGRGHARAVVADLDSDAAVAPGG